MSLEETLNKNFKRFSFIVLSMGQQTQSIYNRLKLQLATWENIPSTPKVKQLDI